jgi:hypothetical protein
MLDRCTEFYKSAFGPLGYRIAMEIADRGLGRFAAAVDPAPNLHGELLSKICPSVKDQVKILHSIDDVTNWDEIDSVVVATSSDLRLCEPTFRVALGARQARRQHLRGTDLPPGCATKPSPIGWTCSHARPGGGFSARASTPASSWTHSPSLPRVSAGPFGGSMSSASRMLPRAGSPFRRRLARGLDREHFDKKVADGSLRHVGLGESLHFLAEYLGLPKIEAWDENLEPVIADRETDLCAWTDPQGHDRGRPAGRQGVRTGAVRRSARIPGSDRPARSARPGGPRRGTPRSTFVIRGGVHGDVATSAIIVNAIPRLIEAPPGLHTMASIATIRRV